MNKIIISGNLTRDPELRQTVAGKSVIRFTIAVKRFAQGEDKADFFPVVAWDKNAENIARFFRKGDAILIDGSLQVREWEGNDGVKRKETEINASRFEFFSSRRSDEQKPSDVTDIYRPSISSTEQFEPLDGEDLPF